MKIDWFRSLIVISLLVLVFNFYYLIQAPLNFPQPEITISPHTGVSQTQARIYGLEGNRMREQPVVIESGKRDRYRAVMDAYQASSLTKVDSLRLNDAYEQNNRIYLDLGRNSFSHPLITQDNIRLHVQAIVNSLTSNNRQLPVQFLFDQSILTDPIENLTFRQPFLRDETVLGYGAENMRQLVAEFLNLIEEEQYGLARAMVYLSDQDRLTESELLHRLRSYRQAKKDATARRIEVYTESDGYLVQVHFTQTGRPENWTVQVINKLYYIVFANSPLDR